MVNDDLEAQIAALTHQLHGADQAQGRELRAKIEELRQEILHRERNTVFMRDSFIDDEGNDD